MVICARHAVSEYRLSTLWPWHSCIFQVYMLKVQGLVLPVSNKNITSNFAFILAVTSSPSCSTSDSTAWWLTTCPSVYHLAMIITVVNELAIILTNCITRYSKLMATQNLWIASLSMLWFWFLSSLDKDFWVFTSLICDIFATMRHPSLCVIFLWLLCQWARFLYTLLMPSLLVLFFRSLVFLSFSCFRSCFLFASFSLPFLIFACWLGLYLACSFLESDRNCREMKSWLLGVDDET